MANPHPKSGYAYTLKHSDAARSGSWSSSSNNDDWDVAMITPRHTSHYMWVGRRHIDGSEVNVWDDAHGRRYIAQTTVMTGRQQLLENPSATTWVIGALAVGGLVWWLTRSKEAKAAAPVKPACPITLEILGSYVKTKPTNYKLYVPPDQVNKPVAAWPAAKPDYLSNPNEHAFSLVDCGFYKWDGTKWVSDETENTALAKHIGATIVNGPRMLSGHPADAFMMLT